jgi:hypothetical protein
MSGFALRPDLGLVRLGEGEKSRVISTRNIVRNDRRALL